MKKKKGKGGGKGCQKEFFMNKQNHEKKQLSEEFLKELNERMKNEDERLTHEEVWGKE